MNDALFGVRTGSSFAAAYHRVVRPRLDELDALRKRRLLEVVGTWTSGLLLTLLLGWGLFWIEHQFLALLAVIGGFMLTRWLATRQARSYREAVKNLVMPPVCEFIGDLTYSAEAELAIDPAPFRDLGLIPVYDRVHQEDLFRGGYRGRRFLLVECELRRVTGGKHRRVVLAFRGLLIAINVEQPSAGRLVIGRPAGLLGDWINGWAASWGGLAPIAFGDPDFDALFRVYGDAPATAQALLTPALRASLVEIARERGERGFTAGFDGRRLLVAFEAGPLFEAGGLLRPARRLELDIDRVLREVTIPHRLIDYLAGGRPGPL